MRLRYPRLFEPVKIGKVEIKNRLAMAPMGIVHLTNPDGSPTQRAIDYYIERARGGVGLIITSLFKVDDEIEPMIGTKEAIGRGWLAPMGELCELVHALGTKIFVQLTAGFGRVSILHRLRDGPISASANPHLWDSSVTCRPLETTEVEKIVKDFGKAAEILVDAGVDGVELHGHEGYLFDQFTTPIWNRRKDKYGGDLKGRLTFPVEVLREIKKRAGDDFPVQYRYGLKHYIKGLNSAALRDEQYQEAGRDIKEGLEMTRLLEEAGFDALHVDAGCYDSWYWAHPPIYQEHGCMVDLAAMVKKITRIPITAVGRIVDPEMAERVITEEKADIVAIGRGLLADPYWPIKAAEGRAEDIRPCIGCHDGCIWRFAQGKPLSCAVNPACGRESLYKLSTAEKRKKVLVAGGGVAGMETARIAAIRGHKVTLYEKGKSLGGHAIAASVPHFKKDIGTLLDWYKTQIKKWDIEVKLETTVSVDLINRELPDVVVVATGSKPCAPDIPGIDKPGVVTCIDLLIGKKKAGKTVVVIGGGLVGCETALWLAEDGKEVTIVEMLPELMSAGLPVPPMNRVMLQDLLAFNKVNILSDTCLKEVTDEGIIVNGSASGKKAIKADTVVLATGLVPEDELYKALVSKMIHLYALGDCQRPRNIMGALWDGYELGRLI